MNWNQNLIGIKGVDVPRTYDREELNQESKERREELLNPFSIGREVECKKEIPYEKALELKAQIGRTMKIKNHDRQVQKCVAILLTKGFGREEIAEAVSKAYGYRAGWVLIFVDERIKEVADREMEKLAKECILLDLN